MEKVQKTLKDIPISKECIIHRIVGEEGKRLRLFDLGFFQGSHVVPLYECHGGGTRVYYVKNTLIAIRSGEAKKILAEEAEKYGDEK